MAELKKTQENVRKGLFQRFSIMQKEMADLRAELKEVKSKIYDETDALLEDFGLLKKVE